MPTRDNHLVLATRVEKLAAVVLVAASLAYLVPFVHAMATTSLWNDEIYTNFVFSGRGPVRVLTYYEGNSHVLYNLVSSVFPGRSSMDPLRQRIFSFLAVGALLFGGLWLFWKRGRPLEGALFFSVFAVHREFLDLSLQARGYGFLAFFAGLASWASIRWLASGRRKWIGLLAAATVLGAWTVPTFVFFGGALLVLLFLRRPGREVLVAGAASAALAAALYVPLLGGLLEEWRLYPVRWGRFYSGFEQVGETIRLYVVPSPLWPWPVPPWLCFGLLAALVIGPGLMKEERARDREGAQVLVGAALIFLTACLFLTTPPVRTTAFVAVPLVLAGLLQFPSPGAARPWKRGALALILVALLLPSSIRAARGFAFVPIENWGELASFVRQAVPRDAPVALLDAPHLLRPYLPGGPVVAGKPDLGAFGRGEVVVVDDVRSGPRFRGTDLAPRALEFRFPQRRGGYLAAWLAPPADRHVVEVREERGPEGTSVEVRLAPGPSYRSLVLRSEREVGAVAPRGWIVSDSGWKLLDPASVSRTDRGVLVPLSGERVVSVVVRLRSSEGAAPSGIEAWAFPERP